MNKIKNALKNTGVTISHELRHCSLDWINESVFRYFFIKELFKQYPKAVFETEWKRFDLLITDRKKGIIIELKFFFLNKHRDLNGKFKNYKGRPSKKNKQEFIDCIKKISSLDENDIKEKYVVLVYEITNDNNSFGKIYDSRKLYKMLNVEVEQSLYKFIVAKREDRVLRAKLIKV